MLSCNGFVRLRFECDLRLYVLCQSWDATYPIIDKDLALLFTLGLGHADGCNRVERGNAQFSLSICSLLALLEECADALVLDLLGGGRAGGLLGLGNAVGVGALAAFASTLGRGVLIFHSTRTARRHDVGVSSSALPIS